MKRILIATDGSPSAREALLFGLELAAEQKAHPTFVHVVPVVDIVAIGGFGATAKVPHEPTDADYEPLREASRLAEDAGIPATTKLLTGDVVDEIVAYADTLNADLIVVGSRGQGTIATALLGSVSRGVLNEARRPVLVVRGAHVLEEALT